MSETKAAHPADRLMAAIEAKRSPVCVGIDPVIERMPEEIRKITSSVSPSMFQMLTYSIEVIKAVSAHVPCVKIQSACFERLGTGGSIVNAVVAAAAKCGVQVILDAKRGDIGVSASHYAAAAFDPSPSESRLRAGPDFMQPTPDWLTINSYLGEDGITPFLKYEGHGAFALVRTSNPGGDAIQNLELKDGGTVSHAVARIIAGIGGGHIGKRGYSALGAVVGATKKQDAAKLRELMPQQMFLVPGYGAQGGGADDVLPCFKADGTGAIVTASRSVIYAFDPKDPKWHESVGEAAAKFAEEVGRAVGMR